MTSYSKKLQAAMAAQYHSPYRAAAEIGVTSTSVYRWLDGDKPTITSRQKVDHYIRDAKLRHPERYKSELKREENDENDI